MMKPVTRWCPDCHTSSQRTVPEHFRGTCLEQCCDTCHDQRRAALDARDALASTVTGGEERPPIQPHPYGSPPEVLIQRWPGSQTGGGRRVVRKSEPMGG